MVSPIIAEFFENLMSWYHLNCPFYLFNFQIMVNDDKIIIQMLLMLFFILMLV